MEIRTGPSEINQQQLQHCSGSKEVFLVQKYFWLTVKLRSQRKLCNTFVFVDFFSVFHKYDLTVTTVQLKKLILKKEITRVYIFVAHRLCEQKLNHTPVTTSSYRNIFRSYFLLNTDTNQWTELQMWVTKNTHCGAKHPRTAGGAARPPCLVSTVGPDGHSVIQWLNFGHSEQIKSLKRSTNSCKTQKMINRAVRPSDFHK